MQPRRCVAHPAHCGAPVFHTGVSPAKLTTPRARRCMPERGRVCAVHPRRHGLEQRRRVCMTAGMPPPPRASPRRLSRARGGRAPERGRVRVRRLGLQPLQAALLLGGGGGAGLRCRGRLLCRAARLADLPGAACGPPLGGALGAAKHTESQLCQPVRGRLTSPCVPSAPKTLVCRVFLPGPRAACAPHPADALPAGTCRSHRQP